MTILPYEELNPNNIPGLTITNLRMRYSNEKYQFSCLLNDIITIQSLYSTKPRFIYLAVIFGIGMVGAFLERHSELSMMCFFITIFGIGMYFLTRKQVIKLTAKDGEFFEIKISGKNQAFVTDLTDIIEKKKMELNGWSLRG